MNGIDEYHSASDAVCTITNAILSFLFALSSTVSVLNRQTIIRTYDIEFNQKSWNILHIV